VFSQHNRMCSLRAVCTHTEADTCLSLFCLIISQCTTIRTHPAPACARALTFENVCQDLRHFTTYTFTLSVVTGEQLCIYIYQKRPTSVTSQAASWRSSPQFKICSLTIECVLLQQNVFSLPQATLSRLSPRFCSRVG